MLYNPSSLDPYAPIWYWGDRDVRSYVHLAGVQSVDLRLWRASVSGYTTSLRISRCTAPAVLAMQTEPEAVVSRMRLWRGNTFAGALPWIAADLDIQVWQKYATPVRGVLLLNTHTGEAVAELPFFAAGPDDRKVLVSLWIEALLELLPGAELAGVSSRLSQHDTSQAVLQTLPSVALEGGMLSAVGKTGIRVSTILGDHRMLQPVSLEELVPSRALIASTESRVLTPHAKGAVRMAVLPPSNKIDIYTFNSRLAISPHRLFSWEILRVLQTLKVIRQWYQRWPDIAQLPAADVEVNLVRDKRRSATFLCADEFTKCFKPIEHIWRTHVDTTWHGLPAAQELGPRELGRL